MQSLKDKISEYLMNAAHTGSMMEAGKTISFDMFDKEAGEILQLFSAELDKIQIEIGQLDHHNILDKVDKIIDKARKELGE